MRQYMQIKNQNPDTILFFRLGDFYEMFGPDALLASRELEITLTGRDAGMENRVPMCGVPYHAAENYINKLVQKGYKVAICEQLEDPKLCKGIVKRDIIRVITPGTSVDPQIFNSPASSYLAALVYHHAIWGLAACDVSTGEFWVSEFHDPQDQNILRDELCRLNPAEILIPDGDLRLKQTILRILDKPLITSYKSEAFLYQRACQNILDHFRIATLETCDCHNLQQAIESAGAVLSYLLETQKTPPKQLQGLKHYYPQDCLMLDATTFRNLEITRTLRANDKKGSLLEILDKTKTAPGSRMLRLWLERPLTDKTVLEERYLAVDVLMENWSQRQNLRGHLEGVYDLERLMTRILYNRALPKELISFKNSLGLLPKIKEGMGFLEGSEYIKRLTAELDTLDDVYAQLDQALEDDPPYHVKDGGVIKTGYHPEIDKLREASRHGKEWIARLETQEKENTGIKSLKVGFNKVFGYYFEVTKANLSAVPAYFQRKQTLANGERYVTEELIRLENQVLGAEEKLLALEEEVYQQTLRELGTKAERVQKTTYRLAQFDVLQGLAEAAVQNSYTRPQLLDKEANVLNFEALRHPVVEKLAPELSFVPNDLQMPAETNLFIITGPNMGGKSTFCRSVALAVIMAQAGSFVPAKRAEISLRDRVFARVGASDDLRSGQSTFMVEMNEVANILRHATGNSLVILDEVGRGTSTYDGLSVAWAVSEYLVKTAATKTLFATHYHELTQLEHLLSGIQNLSASVSEKGEEIILLHKIVSGPADKSYGIHVGRLAGLPGSVLQRAKEILHVLERESLDKDVRSDLAAAQKISLPQTGRAQDEEAGEIARLILDMDLLNMSPLEALNQLYRLQNTLKER